jgi:hypothetical protein
VHMNLCVLNFNLYKFSFVFCLGSMEEIKLFYELYSIKNEIERDLSVINKLECDVKMKSILDKNRELDDEMLLIKKGFDLEIQDKKSEILRLRNEIETRDEIIEDQDSRIKKLNESLKDMIDENKRMNVEFNNLRGILLFVIYLYII